MQDAGRLNDVSAWYHLGGVAIVVLALAFFAPLQPVSSLFAKTFTTVTDQPLALQFAPAILMQ